MTALGSMRSTCRLKAPVQLPDCDGGGGGGGGGGGTTGAGGGGGGGGVGDCKAAFVFWLTGGDLASDWLDDTGVLVPRSFSSCCQNKTETVTVYTLLKCMH